MVKEVIDKDTTVSSIRDIMATGGNYGLNLLDMIRDPSVRELLKVVIEYDDVFRVAKKYVGTHETGMLTCLG